MLTQLKNLFSSFVLKENCSDKNIKKYRWFITPDQTIFGVEKAELSERDLQLLKAFTQPYEALLPSLTTKENEWWKRISNTEESKQPQSTASPYRFVYFIMPEQQADPISFKEALHVLFGYEAPILWLHPNEGVLIEEINEAEDQISYSQIIDTLTSDLYVNIKFLPGPFQSNLTRAPAYYQELVTFARSAFERTDKNVLTYMEAIVFSVLSHTDAADIKSVSTMTLQEFADDQPFLDTLTVFFQCNLNLSEAAKQLYMHRNSLQYRLDKFRQKTGLDVRDFHQAVTVYLGILFKHFR
ncbi:PucR family transcriptional regulator [Virgibacillus halophilus]|uniref:Helix-turn-helix domain-containing protein n=1 Tax=Tigheibacillus halophilus TaxID=361280 RepID=A0ABU5CAV7_9BACI|nr:helix-turn-helix domain-containing protein [Virgibacillus halophilus]